MQIGLELLSTMTHFEKYARYISEKRRRENYLETVKRSHDMMVRNVGSRKDPLTNLKIIEELNWAYSLVRQKKVLPSMRNMQFAGEAIEKNNARIYNCWYANIEDFRTMAEMVFLLLSGGGVGYSVRKRHISKLPPINKPNLLLKPIVYTIEDSIEGWADAYLALLTSYVMGGQPLLFDYSEIRKKGTPLKTSGGKAPGAEKFALAMKRAEALLASKVDGQQLIPLDVHHLMCMVADAIKSGGIRRSAMICIFDADDYRMINCKSGDWYDREPWLANANNSAAFEEEDDEVAITAFDEFWDRAKVTQTGDPGLVRVGEHDGLNPCLWSQTAVIIKGKGLSTFADLKIGDEIWSETGWTKVLNKWVTGVKKVYKYRTSAGQFIGTSNHRIVENGKKIQVGKAQGIDRLVGPQNVEWKLDPQFIMDGLVFGDGVHAKGRISLIVGVDDHDYFDSEISHLLHGSEPNIEELKCHRVTTNIPAETMSARVFDRMVPEYIWKATDADRAAFLRGLYSANGSVVANGGRVTLKGTNKDMIYDVQKILNSLGIGSYITINHSKDVEFSNGTYTCKESYDLNITSDRILFRDKIGFIQKYKQDKISDYVDSKYSHPRSKVTFDIKEAIYIGTEEVYDITVDNEPHTFWADGSNVSNCAEVGLHSFQACNLTEINGAMIETQEDLNDAARAAAIIATAQASFTNFTYLRDKWREITEKEALIGVGITGLTSGQTLNLNMTEAAQIVLDTNEQFAALIGINAAARTTVIKPSGSTSSVLGCNSGIHDWHYRYFVRHALILKSSPLYNYIKSVCSGLINDSKTKADEAYLAYPVKIDEQYPVANDVSALEFLERVKKVQREWVLAGHRYGKIVNNVSNTITIKPDIDENGRSEWDDVQDWVKENWRDVKALSWTPKFEGNEQMKASYPQPPFMVIDEEEFNRRIALLNEFNLDGFIEEDDMTDLQGEAACGAGGCEV